MPRVYTQLDKAALASLGRDRDFFILKPHGDIDHFETIVLTRSDYQEIMFRDAAFRTAFTGLLNGRTFLFLGYGLSDPDFMLLIENLSAVFRNFGESHYALMPNVGKIKRWCFSRNFNIEIISYKPSGKSHPQVSLFLQLLIQS